MKLKVILADDHPIVRLGLHHMLKSSGIAEVVAEANSPSKLLHALSTVQCDIVVTDLCMPDDHSRDGLSLIQRLTRLYPGIPVIVITVLRNAGLLRSVLQRGARGLINKASDVSELALALHAASKGRTYIDKGLRATLSTHTAPLHVPPPLTVAETEVLRLFACESLSAQQIAARLHRSHKTVSRHKRSVQAKLGLETNQELLDYCRHVDLGAA
ncbi:response regulator transcription factor [Dyella choica]|nr:response regulator transcription factor [Dyella choica]